MTTSILIPFRGDNGQRDRLWAHCQKLWSQTPYEIVVGTDAGNGPFNTAQALNSAHTKATGDKLIIYGADQLPDTEAINEAVSHLEHHPWVAVYNSTATHTPESTERILAGLEPTQPPTTAPLCVAIIGIRADKWINYDERFRGWGSEDTAWRHALQALYGDAPTPTGTLQTLYHEPASRARAEDNYRIYREYVDAHNAGNMRDYLVTHGLIGATDAHT